MNRLQRVTARAKAAWQTFKAEAITTSHSLYRAMMAEELRKGNERFVTELTAMQLTAVYSCVRVLGEDVAKLPLNLYRKLPRGREKITDHWIARLLEQPNPWQTGFEFREMMQSHLELAGNFYAIKTIVGTEVRELLPIPIHRMKVERLDNWNLRYTIYMPNGTVLEPPASHVLHVRGLSLDGVMGVSPIEAQRTTVGLGMDLRDYGAKLFSNGAMIGGMLQHPGPQPLSDDAARRLKESFEEKYAGIGNAHKTILLEEGTTYTAAAMKATDAQYIESMKFNRAQIAAIYRVPPHLIGDLERATFSNIEQQSRDYVENALVPRLVRLEARLAAELIPFGERQTLFLRHLTNALLRGNYAERMVGYTQSVTNGWMTRNEVRELEDMNPGPAALDEFLVPLNMQDANAEPPKPSPAPKPDEPPRALQLLSGSAAQRQKRRVVRDADDRIVAVVDESPFQAVPMRKRIVRDKQGTIIEVIEEPLTPEGAAS